jgi:phage shock protein PspC (stress-responsive transcriptional regulator)
VTREQATDLGRLRRSTTDRRVAGVAGGLARHLDIDPVIVRVTLVVLVFFGGAGLLAYVALWLLVPEDTDSSAPLGLDDRNRGIALVVVGVVAVLAMLGDWSGAFWFPWPLIVVGLLGLWIYSRARSPERRAGTYPEAATAYPAYPPYAPQPVPRRRGPILFWFTLALIAVGIGTLGIIDVAGTDVADAAYPALALATTGLMLVVGAFWGRAGGLILVGLVAGVATLGATASSQWERDDRVVAPTSASQVEDEYHMNGGRFVLDLSQVDDVEDLDGRDLEVHGGVGDVEVIVPDDMDVSAQADVGVGASRIFDREGGGFGTSRTGYLDGGADVPVLSLHVDMGVGHVTVRDQ